MNYGNYENTIKDSISTEDGMGFDTIATKILIEYPIFEKYTLVEDIFSHFPLRFVLNEKLGTVYREYFNSCYMSLLDMYTETDIDELTRFDKFIRKNEMFHSLWCLL